MHDMTSITASPVKMRMHRAPFAFLLLAGVSWVVLWTLRLPPVDRFVWLPPPESTRLQPPPLRRQVHLRPTNLEIVRNVTPVDLAFIDVSENHKEDPHRGARDEKGNWGYVHDETALRLAPPAFPTDQLREDCQERDSNHVMLTERVFVDTEAHDAVDKSGKRRAKILCIIYSTDAGHKEKIPAIRETWG